MLSPRLHATLVTLMVETRDWNPVACREALDKLTERARGMRPESVVRVVGNYISAENEQGGAYFTSPKLLPEQGPHWDKTEYAHRTVPARCPEHGHPYPCQPCNERPRPTPSRIREIRQQGWTDTATHRHETRQALTGRTTP